MSENQRGFDWGPPTWSYSETLKEWGIYVFLFLCIGGGAWLLIGSAKQGETPIDSSLPTSSSESNPTPAASLTSGSSTSVALASSVPIPPAPTGPTFLVQLGFFGDEESAKLSYQKLKSLGYTGSIALPDDQYEMYRLQIGPFRTEKEAETISRKLNELDFPCFVIESL